MSIEVGQVYRARRETGWSAGERGDLQRGLSLTEDRLKVLKQDRVSAVSDAGSVLFASLLVTAFEHLTQAVPTVVRLGVGQTSGSDPGWSELSLPWRHCDVDSPGEMSAVTSGLLAEGPVLLLPPWSRPPDRAGSGGSWAYEQILLDCAPASRASHLAVVMPASSMTSLRAQRMREALAERWRPVLLLYANGPIPSISRSFQCVTLFLAAHQDQVPALRIFQAPVNAPEQEVQTDFQQLLTRGGGRVRFGYVLREPPPLGQSLGFDRHDPDLLARRAALAGFGPTVPLAEIFDRVGSAFHETTDRDLVRAAGDPAAVRILTGRDLRRDGTIAPPDEDATWAEVPPGYQLKVGDILLPGIFHATDRGGLVAAAVTENDLPVAAGEKVVALRPTAAMDRQQVDFVLQYLRSPLARALAAMTLGPTVHIQWSALAELPVPQPDQALTAALHDLTAAANRFGEWRADAESVLESVFTDEEINASRARIVREGRKLRLRAEAAALLDDYSYVVRTTFPYPIAYRWRGVEAAVSGGATAEAYGSILETAEVLLCYAANVALALAQDAGITVGQVSQIRSQLSDRNSGPGFGEWVAVLEEVRDGRAFRRMSDTEPLYELRSFLAAPAWMRSDIG